MADTPSVPDDPEPTPRTYPRRQVIAVAAAGVGGLAVMGWGAARVLDGDDAASPASSTAAPGSTSPTSTSVADDREARKAQRQQEREQRRAERQAEKDARRAERGRSTDTTEPDARGDKSDTTEPPTTNAVEPTPDATKQASVNGGDVARWSDPATWGGELPGTADVVAIDVPVLLDVDAAVAGVRIGAAGSLEFEPSANRRLQSSRNILVAGRLAMQPARATIRHQIEFTDVDESRFVGGHSHDPIENDVGLWVVEAGVLELHGTPKTAWTHLRGEASRGDASITVDDASGWRVGDEIVITPTESPTVADYSLHHDRRTITSVNGTRVGLDRPLEHAHPEVAVRPGVAHRAEVLNLGRNVIINGRPEGRAHVQMLATSKPQQLSYVGLHSMGPRQGENEVLGRYAIHFHADEDGSRGSVLEGVAVYDSTGHAFAAHLSNGVTFRECIAHDMVDDAFWWDLSLDGGGRDLVPSHDIVYERCVAHFVKSGGNSKFNLTGFLMGAGDGNIARGCVSTGIQGGAESSAGYHWPSLSRDDNTWTFEGNLAHNNRHSGIYFWQNGKPQTLVDSFTAYHCGQGIFAGSYANLVSYRDCTIYACESEGLVISALPAREASRTGDTITYEGMYVDQAGLSDYAVTITKHIARGGEFTEISGSTFMGGKRAQVGIPDGGKHPQLYDFLDCTFDGNEFWLADDVPEETALRVTAADGAFTVRRSDQPGEPRPEWNAVAADS
jgi:hypothetical protein